MPNRIRELRKKQGMTQEALGELIGVKKSAVAKYESGDIANIKKATAEKIAQVFGVSPACVFGWDEGTALAEDERLLLNMFGRLNKEGRSRAYISVRNLTRNPAYTRQSGLALMPVAAHGDGADNAQLQSDIERAISIFGDKIRGDEFET